MLRSLSAWMLALALGVSACEEKKQPAPGAPAPVPVPAAPVRANAADLYKSVASRMSSDLNLGAGEVRFTAKGASIDEGSPGGTWSEVSAKLRANQAIVADLMKADAMERCDFALPTITARTSPAEMQPVLDLTGALRSLARLLKADAARCWSEKDVDGAIGRVVAAYGLCAHAGSTSLVITALTDAALIQLTNDVARTMAEGADGQSLTPAQKRRLREAMDRLDAADPAGLARARKAEEDQAGVGQKLDEAQAKLMQDMARTRQALGGQ